MLLPYLFLVIALFALMPSTVLSQYDVSDAIVNSNIHQSNGTAIIIYEFPKNLEQYHVNSWEMLKDKSFKKSYFEILGNKISNDKWLRTLPISDKNKLIKLNQNNFIVFIDSCKPHVCDSNNIKILFDPKSRSIWAKLNENNKITYFGNPTQEVIKLFDIGN